MKRHQERKQFELLRTALGFLAAELADVENSFHHGKQCSAHAQIDSSQIWVSTFSLQIKPSESGNVTFFSSSRDLPIAVKSVQSALTTSATHGTFSRPSTKRGPILIGLERNTNARESFERC